MKRVLCLLVLFSFIIIMTACEAKEDIKTLKVLATADEYYGTPLQPIREFDLSFSSSIEKDVDELRSFCLSDTNLDLAYVDTMFYSINELKVRNYKIKGTEEGQILLMEDGTPYAILGHEIAKLDILPTDPPEIVRQSLESNMSDLIDYAKYQFWEATPSLSIEHVGRFGAYHFAYYNMNQGYLADYATVFVQDDGSVVGLWIIELNDLAENAINLDKIDKEMEQELIISKLSEIMEEGYEYVEHTVLPTPCIVSYEGEVCIEYSITGSMVNQITGIECGFSCYILIPTQLLTNTE